ncbi:hypothetical protein AHAS_Ahas07G0030000 [Arachis hypogaea]
MGGPPRLPSSRESIHPLSVYEQLSLEHRFRFSLNRKNGALNNTSSQTKNYKITPFIIPDPKHPFSIHREIQSSKSIKRPS